MHHQTSSVKIFRRNEEKTSMKKQESEKIKVRFKRPDLPFRPLLR